MYKYFISFFYLLYYNGNLEGGEKNPQITLKVLIYFKRNRRTNWCDVILNEVGPKRSSFGIHCRS